MSVEWPNQHEGKSWIASKAQAKILLRRHRPEQCPKCTTGRYLWRWYVCRVGGTEHRHLGHRPRNASQPLRLQAQEA